MYNGNQYPLPGGGQQFGNPTAPAGMNPVAPKPQEKKDRSGLVKTICLIFVSLLAVTFFVLFIVMFFNWDAAKTDTEGKINLAVAKAENEIRTNLENEFAEKEKYPYRTFVGPSDFGALTFEFPKTWSVYVPNDASRADDYHAYFNPGLVSVVSDSTVMALRVSIVNRLTDEVKKDYSDNVEDGEMTVSTRIVNGVNVDIFTGEIESGKKGIVCIFKIRDKTAIIQTDAMLFSNDFFTILDKLRFNA